MKTFQCDNGDLIQLLIDNGFIIMCDENMNMTIDDYDATHIDDFVREHAPAAIGDYSIAEME